VNAPLNFDYHIKRNRRRKSLGLYVDKQQVEVRAPHYVVGNDIHAWVISKADWVEARLREQALKAVDTPQIYHDGQLLFFGQERSLKTQTGKASVVEQDDCIIISHPASKTPQDVLEPWLKLEASLYIQERCTELAHDMGLHARISSIGYRKTKSKWGHCTQSGKLQFNWLIIMAPVEVIDYLLIHEICHLQHMNHSKAFWQLVEKYCPQYRQRKSWLDNNGHKIWL
jgi:hypothetical protein